jgi:hypothetical protein
MERWLGLWCSWMPATEAAALVERVLAKPVRFKACDLGERLGLLAAERRACRITTIAPVDQTPDQRRAMRRARDAAHKRARRRDAGVRPREAYEARSAHRTKPWEKAGLSRATWYRLRRETSVSPAILARGADAPVSRRSENSEIAKGVTERRA